MAVAAAAVAAAQAVAALAAWLIASRMLHGVTTCSIGIRIIAACRIS